MILHFIASFLAIVVGAYLIPGVSVTLVSALVLAVLLGVVNVFLKPVIRILTLPINILTLGLFSLVVNALILLGLARIIPDFALTGFWVACVFSIVISLVSSFFALLFSTAE